ncbi:MAG: GNAT family N-acetyltransferase [Cyanobacteria bacterium J06621_8]
MKIKSSSDSSDRIYRMNINENLTIPTKIKRDWSISIEPCNKERDGQFIRESTKQNFYDYLNETIGWNENLHQQEPRFPERYLMLFNKNNPIGFLSLREQPNCLYLETLQLIEAYRGCGLGTALIKFIEDIARKKAKNKIRLRVFQDNPAQFLYHRLEFNVVEDEGWCLLMEKVLKVC